MTTIAYRNGVMAADSQGTGGDIRDCSVKKIAINGRGDLLGGTGDAGLVQEFIGWFLGGEKTDPPKIKEASLECVIVRRNGNIEIIDGGGVFDVSADYYAIGSGRALALGAMAHGASAKQAVKAAIVHDVYSGGKIAVIKHKAG